MLITPEAVDFGILTLLCSASLAYAEIHYKFKFIPSRYRKTAPEIIADIPLRISPGYNLPVLIFVKDADKYPVTLHCVSVHIACETGSTSRSLTFDTECEIAEPWWHRLLWVPRLHGEVGWCEIKVNFKATVAGKTEEFSADNYHLTNHQPFRCYFADELLPLPRHFYAGDLHTHSNYTSDQVEFGAPPIAIAQMAQAMGHHFTAITDHSYDLDDYSDNYLKNDPDIQKWQDFQAEIAFCNGKLENFVTIAGEEVSCGNANRQNVHMLAFNHPDYIPGAGDSGEKWLRTAPDLSVAEIVAQPAQGSLFFAAHPLVPVPFLQRLLLRRNNWHAEDFAHPNLHGLQIWNGHVLGMTEARQNWIDLLLAGDRKFIIAGSDAHGNFNRFRQIKMPHLWMEEQDRYHLFGQHCTIAYIEYELTLDNLLSALRNGACAITAGPFLAIKAVHAGQHETHMGGTIIGNQATLTLNASSTREFGEFSRIVLFKGEIGAGLETVLVDESFSHRSYDFTATILLDWPEGRGCYYRAELYCNGDADWPIAAMTNPIWHFSAEAPAQTLPEEE